MAFDMILIHVQYPDHFWYSMLEYELVYDGDHVVKYPRENGLQTLTSPQLS